MRVALLICLAVAALSVVLADEPTYDPLAWLIWGRQIGEGFLETTAGPSWKPLPVAFTVPFSLFGDDAAQALWLVVARAGGLAGLVLAWRLAARLGGGALGGAVAAGSVLLASEVVLNVGRGDSEGLLVAFVLGAIDRHLDNKPGQAFALGVAAALLRPEVWLLLAAYALWWLARERSPRAAVAIGVCGVLVLAAWFVPEKIGSGDWLRGASRAQEKVAGSPGASDSPFLNTFSNSSDSLPYPVYAGAILALVVGFRERRREVLAVAALAAILMVTVALLAVAGFTGNLRYVTLPAALVCVLAGVGWGWLAHRSKVIAALAALAAIPGIVSAADTFGDSVSTIARTERISDDLPNLIARAGGREAVLVCGPVSTGPFQTQMVAWRLHVRQQQVGLRGQRTRVQTTTARPPQAPARARSREWVLYSECP